MRNINFLFISPRYREVETPRANRTCGIKRVIRARCYISLCVWVSLKRVNRAGISDDPHFENAVLIKRWWILNRPFVGSLRSGDEAAPIRQSPIGFVGKRRLESSTATMARREIRGVASRWKTRRKKERRRKRIKRQNERGGYYYCQKIKWSWWHVGNRGGIQVAYGVWKCFHGETRRKGPRINECKSVYSGGKDEIAIRVTSIHFCRKNSLRTFCASYNKKINK